MFKLILIIFSLLIVVGCGSDDIVIDETLPTTTHFAMSDRIDDDNWQDFITIEINSDDIITNVEMNSIAQTAMATRRDLAQLDDYEAAFGYDFYEDILTLENSLIGLSRNELASAIQNASFSTIANFDTMNFGYLAEQALNSEPVETGVYIDGWYQSILDANDEGFSYFVNLFIQHGDIIAVHWNAINEEGILKYDPLNATAVDVDAIEWRNQAHFVEQSLIARQDPTLFSFDEDGLSTDIPNVNIEVESFISLATQALAAGPLARETRGED
jgi:major membrane immunogen (membrane-anchored lipoprotein)